MKRASFFRSGRAAEPAQVLRRLRRRRVQDFEPVETLPVAAEVDVAVGRDQPQRRQLQEEVVRSGSQDLR